MKSRNNYVIILGIVFIGSIFSMVSLTSAQDMGFDETLLQDDISLINTQFNSFDLDYNGISIRDDYGNLIDSTTSRNWGDKSFRNYPQVEVFNSDPFFVDPVTYNAFTSEQELQEYLNKRETDAIEVKDTETDKVYYLKLMDVAFDIGWKTRSNLPDLRTWDIYLSPLNNIYHSNGGREDWDAFDGTGGRENSGGEFNHNPYNSYIINDGQYDIDTRDGWEGYQLNYDSAANNYWAIDTTNRFDYSGARGTFPYKEWTYQGTEPIGVLAASCLTGQDNWQVELSDPNVDVNPGRVGRPGQAYLPASLEPIGGFNEWGYVDLFGQIPISQGLATYDNWYSNILEGTDTPIGEDTETWPAAQNAADSSKFQYALDSLSSRYGNSKVLVDTSFNVQALTEFLQNNYKIEKVINNVPVTIDVFSTSAKIGIVDVVESLTDSEELHGLVINDFTAAQEEIYRTDTFPDDQIESKWNNLIDDTDGKSDRIGAGFSDEDDFARDFMTGSKPALGGITVSLDYHIQFEQLDDKDLIGGVSDSLSPTFSNFNEPTQININNFDALDTDFDVDITTELQPITRVFWARYNVLWSWQFRDTNIFDDSDTEKIIGRANMDVEYPVKMTTYNVFSVQRIVFRVAILTENKAEITIANGRPITVDDFHEFNNNQLGIFIEKYLKGTLSQEFFDFGQFFNDLLSSPFGTIIVIVIIVVAIILGIVLFSFLGRAFGGGGRGPIGGGGTGGMFGSKIKINTTIVMGIIIAGLVVTIIIVFLVV